MKLETLIENITPLPLVRFGDKREQFITGLLPDGVSNTDPLAKCYSTTDAEPNAAYLVHCANNFPKLLEALERSDEALKTIHQVYLKREGKPLLKPEELIQAAKAVALNREALTQAREVKG